MSKTSETKNKRCHIQLTEADKETFTERAKELGLRSFSEYAAFSMKNEMSEKPLIINKVMKNTVKSNLSNVYSDDIQEILNFISCKKLSSNYSEQLDRLLYTQSRYPDKFDEQSLKRLEQHIEELKEMEKEIMSGLNEILNKRKQASKRDVKKQLDNIN